jgi:acyl dehydratase
MTFTTTPAGLAIAGRHQLLLKDVSIGDEIPVFMLPLTLQRLVMEAGVNRDFTPLHHDDEDTRLTGAPRSYANAMLIQALIEAALRTWMGDCGWLRELGIKMVSFNFAGSVVSAGGVVTAVDVQADGTKGDVHVDVWMRSDETLTVTGTAIVSLPANGNPASISGSMGTSDVETAGGDQS